MSISKKIVALCAIFGGVYGATLGVTIGAVPGAAEIIGIAAAACALLFGGPGLRYGAILGIINRSRFGRYYVGMAAMTVGAIVGGLLAAMLLMAFGAALGAVVGWFAAPALVGVRRGLLARLMGRAGGVMLGTFVGVVLWAVHLGQVKAFLGLACGMGVGIVVGPLLLLLVARMLNGLPRVHAERRDYLNATFQRED